jgi:hypothetical protein
MGGSIKTLALYTTIYPGVEKYLADWYRSLQEQTDQDYQLWIGLDLLDIAAATDAMGGKPEAIWVSAPHGDTPAQVRQRVFAQIVEQHDGVILVDSDDVLHSSRVEAARAALQTRELVGCALRLVNNKGKDMGMTFSIPPQTDPQDVLPRNNVFGLSNTAFRSDLLRKCLPIPANIAMVDWFLATKAWLYGADIVFDETVRMDYRQHDANMARVRPPFSVEQVISDTNVVRHHFDILLNSIVGESIPERHAKIVHVAADVELFYQNIVLHPEKLNRYTQSLNEVNPAPLWWACVAHPSLSHLWS